MARRAENSAPVDLRYGAPVLLVVLLLASTLSGCGGKKEARAIDRILSRTATAVDVAKSEGTKRYAATELAAAEERLIRAQRAAQAKEYERADRLVAESLVNVNLATAKAEAARIREQIEQIKGSPTSVPKTGAPKSGPG